MPFDPALPRAGTKIRSAEVRGNFNGLKELFDTLAASAITGAVLDAINTVEPGQPAGMSIQIIDGVMHFTFNIPRGAPGPAGTDGTPGGPGPAGPPGPPFANALIGGVTTLNAGENAFVTVSFDGTNVQFFFGIPRGIDGFGGITPQQLDTAIAGTSRNTNNVALLNQTADATYNPSQIQSILNKIDEHLNSARR